MRPSESRANGKVDFLGQGGCAEEVAGRNCSRTRRAPALHTRQSLQGLTLVRNGRETCDILFFWFGMKFFVGRWTRPLTCEARDGPVARANTFQFSIPLSSGVAEVAFYCAHRATTASPWGLCEHEGTWPLLPRPSEPARPAENCDSLASRGLGLIERAARLSRPLRPWR